LKSEREGKERPRIPKKGEYKKGKGGASGFGKDHLPVRKEEGGEGTRFEKHRMRFLSYAGASIISLQRNLNLGAGEEDGGKDHSPSSKKSVVRSSVDGKGGAVNRGGTGGCLSTRSNLREGERTEKRGGPFEKNPTPGSEPGQGNRASVNVEKGHRAEREKTGHTQRTSKIAGPSLKRTIPGGGKKKGGK